MREPLTGAEITLLATLALLCIAASITFLWPFTGHPQADEEAQWHAIPSAASEPGGDEVRECTSAQRLTELSHFVVHCRKTTTRRTAFTGVEVQ